MYNFIKNLFTKPEVYNGVLPDLRSDEEKAKDWQALEVFAPKAPVFREVKENEWKRYQVRNQDGSGSCVANTVAKMLEVKRFIAKNDVVKFSHAPIYINRSNKPQGGMVGQDALQLAVKYSSCPETEMPSENKNDAQLDAMQMPLHFEDINNYVKPNAYLMLPLDFDYVASMVEQEGAVMIWVDTSYSCWQKDIPTAGGKGGGVRHSITVVDAITLNGVQYLVIEDSWGRFGKYNGQRLITREFFKDAVFFSAVLTEFVYDIDDTAIFTTFDYPLEYKMENEEVRRLQRYLKAKGFFPQNKEVTKFYGNITAKAVYDFQVAHNVASLAELNQLKGRRVGAKTLQVINANLT